MKNIILQQANFDYKPDIVAINYEVINDLNFSSSFNSNYQETLSPMEMSVLSGMDLEKAIHFLLGLNSINYKYWSLNPDFVRYENNNKIGAIAAFEGFTHLFFDMNDENDFYKINEELIKKYFGDIPDIGSRIEILRESLNSHHVNLATQTILNAIEKKEVLVETAKDVAHVLPLSFNDPYLKKIQLALYEIVIFANNEHHQDIKYDLTVAADYQLPKVLEAIGVLQYNEELKEKINQSELLAVNGRDELAIRSATILSCEAIIEQHQLSVSFLDRWLWLQRNDFPHKKFHLTQTTYY